MSQKKMYDYLDAELYFFEKRNVHLKKSKTQLEYAFCITAFVNNVIRKDILKIKEELKLKDLVQNGNANEYHFTKHFIHLATITKQARHDLLSPMIDATTWKYIQFCMSPNVRTIRSSYRCGLRSIVVKYRKFVRDAIYPKRVARTLFT